MNISEILSKVPLFSGIAIDEIESLITRAQYHVRTYEKGQLIAQRGDQCNQLMILIEGKVTAEMLDISGKTLKIEDAEAPQTLATAFLFGKDTKIPVNVTAITICRFLYIPRNRFQSILKLSDQLMENFIGIISMRAQFLSEKVKFMSFNTIRQKLAHLLLEHMKNEGEHFSVGKPQTTLAEIFGVARPSLARCIGELEDEGLISHKSGNYIIYNVNSLKMILEE